MIASANATFSVNRTADAVDAAPGNGVCAAANGACPLRAAIMEANALTGAESILIPAGTDTLTIPGTSEGPLTYDPLSYSGRIVIRSRVAVIELAAKERHE